MKYEDENVYIEVKDHFINGAFKPETKIHLKEAEKILLIFDVHFN